MRAVFEDRRDSIYSWHLRNSVRDFSTMFHKLIEILYIKEGSHKICVNGKNYVLNDGDLYIIFPYMTHSNPKSRCSADLIMVDPDMVPCFKDAFLSYFTENPIIRASALPECIPFLMQKVMDTEDGEYSKETVSGYLTALLGEILGSLTLSSGERVDTTALQKILTFCTENYTQDINLNEVSKNAHVSKSYVTYVFTKKLGYSFRKFINDMRIDHAKKLLAESDMSVIDIMLECGYQNQSTFNKAFAERSNTPPMAYRKKLKKEL